MRTSPSVHFRRLRRYPEKPKTLGEHLWKKRIDLGLSMPQLVERLRLGVTDGAVERWEKNLNRIREPHRTRIIEFLGYDPAG
ncbi:MAG: hypothetical protein FJ387_28110 [Verrucomicrobia bacterium]|nr:hypothetical protein [Verrucomicrobiota bacterium]